MCEDFLSLTLNIWSNYCANSIQSWMNIIVGGITEKKLFILYQGVDLFLIFLRNQRCVHISQGEIGF